MAAGGGPRLAHGGARVERRRGRAARVEWRHGRAARAGLSAPAWRWSATFFVSTMGTKRKAPVDFQRTRKKLGKGKQASSNATDTSFRAKSIAVPTQSISVDRSQSYTTRRNQTIGDLAVLMRHASATVRRDAVQGFTELITTHAGLLAAEHRALLSSVLMLIGDDDVGVRALVIRYLRLAVRALPAETRAAHADALLLYTTSALSHIQTAVRLDALLVLELLLETMPQAASAGWEHALGADDTHAHGARVLSALLVLLGVGAHAGRGARSAVSVDMRPGDRLRVLRTLAAFLAAALDARAGEWYIGGAFGAHSDWERFATMFAGQPPAAPRAALWTDAALLHTRCVASGAVCDAVRAAAGGAAAGGTGTGAGAGAASRLLDIIHPPLLAALLDALAAADGENAEVVAAVLAVYAAVWRSVVRASRARDMRMLEQLLAHLGAHLPTDAVGGSTGVRINARFCELVALAAAGGVRAPRVAYCMEHTLWYLVALLRGEHGPLAADVFEALVPTLWLLLLAEVAPGAQTALLGALLHLCARAPPRAPVLVPAHGLIARLCVLHMFPSVRASVPALDGVRAELQTWLLGVPRALWDAATHAVTAKDAAAASFVHEMLMFLHAVAAAADGVCFDAATRHALAPRLRPLLTAQHPRRGAVPGPCARMAGTCHIAGAILTFLQ